ncbi:hypothetical protein GCM10010372_58610 [Streptomyces tauricus]|nr:hypothetical protein GCM10010372_58610 [Streptomyces tauricus]
MPARLSYLRTYSCPAVSGAPGFRGRGKRWGRSHRAADAMSTTRRAAGQAAVYAAVSFATACAYFPVSSR